MPADDAAAVRLLSAPPASPAGRVVHDDLGIRVDRDGVWYYHGSPIQRKELVCLFASTLTRDEDGGYWLVTPVEMGRIEVEDVPFLAVELFSAGQGRERVVSLRTNIDEIVTADAEHRLFVVTSAASGEPTPYVGLERGLQARLTRPVYYELVALAEEREHDGHQEVGVWSRGTWFALGSIATEP